MTFTEVNPHRALRTIAAGLILALVPAPELLAQASATVKPAAPLMLHINILEGEEALNNIKERTAREPIVQVEDENHKPVAGVVIVFTSIRGSNGAGGTFNTFTQYRTVTNAEGKATGRGFQPNTTSGQFTIQVTAAIGATTVASAIIHETNTSGVAGESSSQPTSQTGAQTGTQAGGAVETSTASRGGNVGTQTASTAGTRGGFLHVFNIVPKWVVVGVVAGTAAAVTVAVAQANSGTTISTGTGSVGAPTATRPTAGR